MDGKAVLRTAFNNQNEKETQRENKERRRKRKRKREKEYKTNNLTDIERGKEREEEREMKRVCVSQRRRLSEKIFWCQGQLRNNYAIQPEVL